MEMKLYMVAHDNDDGINFDLFVRAATPHDAALLWQAHYETSDWPTRAFEIPRGCFDGEAAAIEWQSFPKTDFLKG